MKYKQIIGSYECIKNQNYAKRIAGIVKRTNMFEVHIRQDVNKEWTVIYYLKDNRRAKEAFNVYLKYERSGGAPDSITLKEHRFLGECFGFDKDEIDWFIEEMKEEGVE